MCDSQMSTRVVLKQKSRKVLKKSGCGVCEIVPSQNPQIFSSLYGYKYWSKRLCIKMAGTRRNRFVSNRGGESEGSSEEEAGKSQATASLPLDLISANALNVNG